VRVLNSCDKDDKELISDYYSCNEKAFGILYGRYIQRIRDRVSYIGVTLREDVDDLAEETFLRVARTKNRKAKLRPGKLSFKNWLYKIARNLVIDFRRRQSTSSKRQSEVTDLLYQASTSRDLLKEEELAEPIRECLNRLSEKHRETLILFADNLTLREIAIKLNIAEGTARSRQFNAKKQMEKCLEEKGYRSVAYGKPLPAGAEIVRRCPHSLLIRIIEVLLRTVRRNSYGC